MTSKRYLKILENNKSVSRDFTKEHNRYVAIHNEGESLEYKIDLSALGTVSSVSGASGTLSANTFTFLPSLTDIDLKFTMGTGEVITVPLRFREYNERDKRDYC